MVLKIREHLSGVEAGAGSLPLCGNASMDGEFLADDTGASRDVWARSPNRNRMITRMAGVPAVERDDEVRHCRVGAGNPTDSRAGTVMWLLSVGGRAYAGRKGDLQESC
jgi:hypothetical protein